jgi:triacylglycerol esterase/lipase EstA (alpha/beta hydrolase family)
MQPRPFWATATVALTATLLAPTAASAESDPPAGPRQSSIAPAFAYALAHPTASPARANDFGCRPSKEHPNPVVLAHGTFENAYENWARLAPELADKGYCVFAPNLGGAPQNPLKGTADIAEAAEDLADFVDRVRSATGSSKVDIVGHSQGGMMPRYYLKNLGGADKVDKLVALTPSNHGTTAHGLATAISKLPGGEAALKMPCEACTQQFKGSDFLNDLNSGGETVDGVTYTVVATKTDEVVTPHTSSFLADGPNVTNTTLQDYCPDDRTEHIGISYNPTALQLVRNALDPDHAEKPGC